jgi:hypothetical protein
VMVVGFEGAARARGRTRSVRRNIGRRKGFVFLESSERRLLLLSGVTEIWIL